MSKNKVTIRSEGGGRWAIVFEGQEVGVIRKRTSRGFSGGASTHTRTSYELKWHHCSGWVAFHNLASARALAAGKYGADRLREVARRVKFARRAPIDEMVAVDAESRLQTLGAERALLLQEARRDHPMMAIRDLARVAAKMQGDERVMLRAMGEAASVIGGHCTNIARNCEG